MRKTLFLSIGLIFGLIGCVAYFSIFSTSSAQKVARMQWEYASIRAVYSLTPSRDKLNKIYGMAEICYLQQNGCKRLEIKHEVDYGEFLVERGLVESYATRTMASSNASDVAFQKALFQLGSEGWELVSEPDIKFESVNIDEYNKYENKSLLITRDNTKAVYFKRLKAQ
jgi:hypothetical protein